MRQQCHGTLVTRHYSLGGVDNLLRRLCLTFWVFTLPGIVVNSVSAVIVCDWIHVTTLDHCPLTTHAEVMCLSSISLLFLAFIFNHSLLPLENTLFLYYCTMCALCIRPSTSLCRLAKILNLCFILPCTNISCKEVIDARFSAVWV